MWALFCLLQVHIKNFKPACAILPRSGNPCQVHFQRLDPKPPQADADMKKKKAPNLREIRGNYKNYNQ